MSGFDAKKHFILSSPPFTVGRDLSPKGSLDTPIIECVEFLNDLADYVTTSSCSGRVSAYRDVGTKGVDWLMVVHGTITVADIHEALASISLEDESLVVLKCEAFILHVLCRDLEAASKLHQIGMECGYRESGLSVSKQMMVAIRTSSFGLEMPLAKGRRLLVDESALKIVVSEANRRIRLNFERIDTFLLAMKLKFQWPTFDVASLGSTGYIRRWGHSSVMIETDGCIASVGGYGSPDANNDTMGTRKLRTVSLDTTDLSVTLSSTNGHEVVHSAMVHLPEMGMFLLSGGRRSPLVALPCLQLLDSRLQLVCGVTESGDVPPPRWGHTLSRLMDGGGLFLLYGGRDGTQLFDDAYLLRIEGLVCSWERVELAGVPGRFFHAAVTLAYSSLVLVHGGALSLEDTQSCSSFLLLAPLENCVLRHINTDLSCIMQRFGHTLSYLGAKTYLLLGGTSFSDNDGDESTGGLLLDLRLRSDESLTLSARPIGVVLSDTRSRVHHQCVFSKKQRAVFVLGGGIHCLAFGPYYCDSLCLSVKTHQFILREVTPTPVINDMPAEDQVDTQDEGVLVVTSNRVKRVKELLEGWSVLNKSKRISRAVISEDVIHIDLIPSEPHVKIGLDGQEQFGVSSGDMAVPVTLPFLEALTSLPMRLQHDSLTALAQCLGRYVTVQRQQVRSNKSLVVSSQRRARDALTSLVTRFRLDAGCLQELPSRYEVVGDVLMIPESALVSPQWLLPGKSGVNVWHLLGECFGLHRVARKARVDEGKMRQSCVHMLWSARPDDDHWTTVVENGISFSFDITRVMFCSGNCTERMRAAHFNVADKIVVDLYCGIGYYTLPFLVKGRAGLVHACEMNPDSICALRRNLAAAGVSPERYFIHEGDNQVTTQMLDSVADVVSLGLLPSSEAGWPLAAAVLRAEGGTLHVHENVHEVSLQSGEWLAMCLYRLGTLMADRGKPMRLVCTHLEKVKSYAPRVFHIVADIDCIPLRDSLLTN